MGAGTFLRRRNSVSEEERVFYIESENALDFFLQSGHEKAWVTDQ